MASYRHKKLATFSFISILMLLVGIILAVVYNAKFKGQADTGSVVLMWSAVGFTAVGFLFCIIGMILFRIADLRDKKRTEKVMDAMLADKEPTDPLPAGQSEQPASGAQYGMIPQSYLYEGNITYIPSREAFEFIDMGKYQTLGEKFAEIDKMDKTQFVIYIARLFSNKGYQVKLTPVIDNHDVDLLVEKMGVTIAISCVLTNRVLSKDDIESVKDGRFYYGANNVMALTNMYFDQDATGYAKQEHMSLVDRNVLAQDFMV